MGRAGLIIPNAADQVKRKKNKGNLSVRRRLTVVASYGNVGAIDFGGIVNERAWSH